MFKGYLNKIPVVVALPPQPARLMITIHKSRGQGLVVRHFYVSFGYLVAHIFLVHRPRVASLRPTLIF